MPKSAARYGSEFQEIAHCGGQFTVDVKTDMDGRRGIAFGFRNSRPNASSIFAVYALPEGLPVGTIQLGGMGQQWNPAPLPNCLPIFIGSDSLGMFGHQCPKCKEYWRSRGSAFALANDVPLLRPKGRMSFLFDQGTEEIRFCMC